MKKSCEFCRFAHVSRNQFEVRLDDGTVVTKTGGMKYVCERPGGVKSLSFNTETGVMTCSEYEEVTGNAR